MMYLQKLLLKVIKMAYKLTANINVKLIILLSCIPRAFGMLTKRVCIFNRPLQSTLDKWSLVCTVAAKLHNICVDNYILETDRYGYDVANGDAWNVFLNERRPDIEHCQRAIGEAGSRQPLQKL